MLQRTELQKYLGARRCTQEENTQDFFKTGEVVWCLSEISSGFRTVFIKYDGESTLTALSFAISDLSVTVRLGRYAANRFIYS